MGFHPLSHKNVLCSMITTYTAWATMSINGMKKEIKDGL
jgi:hypothetical protein